jgi:hypothetical protein
LYLNTADGIKNDGNACDCLFEVGSGMVKKKDSETMTLSLVRTAIPSSISLFRNGNQKYFSGTSYLSNSKYKYDLQIIFTDPAIVNHTCNINFCDTKYTYRLVNEPNDEPYYDMEVPFSYKTNIAEIVVFLNRIVALVRNTATDKFQINEKTQKLEFVSSNDVLFSNLTFIKGSDTYYDGGAQFHRCLGLDTGSNDNFTTIVGTNNVTPIVGIELTMFSAGMKGIYTSMPPTGTSLEINYDSVTEIDGLYVLVPDEVYINGFGVITAGINAGVLARYVNGFTYYMIYYNLTTPNMAVIKVKGTPYCPRARLLDDDLRNIYTQCEKIFILTSTGQTYTIPTTTRLISPASAGRQIYTDFNTQLKSKLFETNILYEPLFLQTDSQFTSFASIHNYRNILSTIQVNSNITGTRTSIVLTDGEEEPAPAPALLGHINLDGADDMLEITLDGDEILSWTKSWSIGLTMPEIHNPTSAQKKTIVKRGNNGLYFACGSGNWGFYMTAMDGVYDPSGYPGLPHSHGANTWFVPPDGSKHLFTYNHTTGKVRWYVDDVLKGTIQATSVEMTQPAITADKLYVGESMSGYYGGTTHWDGHIENLLLITSWLVNGSQQVTDYFTDNDFDGHEYTDDTLSWYKLDPETYPTITDFYGNSTGIHVNGGQSSYISTGTAPAPPPPPPPAGATQTEYYILGFDWGAVNGLDRFAKFEAKINEINALLPAGEPSWVLVSMPDEDAKTAVLDKLDEWNDALLADPTSVSSLGWFHSGGNYVSTTARSFGLSGFAWIGLHRPVWDTGDWEWEDGGTHPHIHDWWGNTPNTANGGTPDETQATITGRGGKYGTPFSAAETGSYMNGYDYYQTPRTAIYQRQVALPPMALADSEYWDLSGYFSGYQHLIPFTGDHLYDFSPNIFAGTAPSQPGTYKDTTIVYQCGGVWDIWVQSVFEPPTWTKTGTTFVFDGQSTPKVSPGIETNGAFFPRATVNPVMTGTPITDFPDVITRFSNDGNLWHYKIYCHWYTGGTSELRRMRDLNTLEGGSNFSGNELATGFFVYPISPQGGVSEQAMCFTPQSPVGNSNIFPEDGVYTITSSRRINLRANWALNGTNYDIYPNSNDLIHGTYVSPTFSAMFDTQPDSFQSDTGIIKSTIPPPPDPPPPDPPVPSVTTQTEQFGFIEYENMNLSGSHKKIGEDILGHLNLKLLDAGGNVKVLKSDDCFYELEVKYTETI